MSRLYPMDVDIKSLNPVTLAFVGDGVYDLMVREMLVSKADRPSNQLHKVKVSIVRAEAQTKAVDIIAPFLSEEETRIFKRGRNAKTSRSGSDYHCATGFETLLGYHYLNDNMTRIRELFDIIFKENNVFKDI